MIYCVGFEDRWRHSYEVSQKQWTSLVPFSTLFSIILCITNKLALYSWNFVDIFIVVIGRIFFFHFDWILQNSKMGIFSRRFDCTKDLFNSIIC